jgi:hypothetical protein
MNAFCRTYEYISDVTNTGFSMKEVQPVIYSCIIFLSLDTGSIVLCVTIMFID